MTKSRSVGGIALGSSPVLVGNEDFFDQLWPYRSRGRVKWACTVQQGMCSVQPFECFLIALKRFGCSRRMNIDHQGVRRNSWTGLCRKSEARSIFARTE